MAERVAFPKTDLSSFQKTTFPVDGLGDAPHHDVYEKGSGTKILLLQELTGLSQKLIDFAGYLVEQGYHVIMPDFLPASGVMSGLRNMAHLLCVRREINALARGAPSPITDWLRALIRDRVQDDAERIGVIGMCLSGGFALALIEEKQVIAAIGSQPSLPMSPRGKVDIGYEADGPDGSQKERIKAAAKEKGCALAMRFQGDGISRQGHIDAWAEVFGGTTDDGGYLRVRQFPGFLKHSLLTAERHAEALHEMNTYLQEQFAR